MKSTISQLGVAIIVLISTVFGPRFSPALLSAAPSRTESQSESSKCETEAKVEALEMLHTARSRTFRSADNRVAFVSHSAGQAVAPESRSRKNVFGGEHALRNGLGTALRL